MFLFLELRMYVFASHQPIVTLLKRIAVDSESTIITKDSTEPMLNMIYYFYTKLRTTDLALKHALVQSRYTSNYTSHGALVT